MENEDEHPGPINREFCSLSRRPRNSIRAGKLHRTRSKTMPSKGSQESTSKYYEIVDVDTVSGRNALRRAPKLSELGRSHQLSEIARPRQLPEIARPRRISRCNSLPSRKHSSCTYETVDWEPLGRGGLYQITDLVESPLKQQEDVFTFESASSSFDSNYTSQSDNPKYHVLTGITKSQSDDHYSTISSRKSQKLKQNKTTVIPTISSSGNYDTPKLNNNNVRKVSSARRLSSTEQVGRVKSPKSPPNYYTVEPDRTGFHIPDVVSTNMPGVGNNAISRQSSLSRTSDILDGYDELKCASGSFSSN